MARVRLASAQTYAQRAVRGSAEPLGVHARLRDVEAERMGWGSIDALGDEGSGKLPRFEKGRGLRSLPLVVVLVEGKRRKKKIEGNNPNR